MITKTIPSCVFIWPSCSPSPSCSSRYKKCSVQFSSSPSCAAARSSSCPLVLMPVLVLVLVLVLVPVLVPQS
jgi:hypothetical protein